ncbi:hypothetical protein IAT38_004699 [Cryptococcus sp. DSM 104549]
MGYFIERPCSVDNCTRLSFGPESACRNCTFVTCQEHRWRINYPFKTTHDCHNVPLSLPDGGVTTLISKGGDPMDDDFDYKRHERPPTLTFDDGVKRVVRARLYSPGNPPAVLQKAITESEVTTVQLLKAEGIKVPLAWVPPTVAGVKDTVVNYYFMEYAKGTAPSFADIDIHKILNEPYTRNFFDSLARHFISLSNIRLPVRSIGSLYPGHVDGSYKLGPLASWNFMMNPRNPYLLGPFKTQRERYLAHFDHALDYVYLMEFENGGVAQLTAYMWLSEARKLVESCAELAREETEFFVKHADDWLKQYMADDDGSLTAVLDWEWAFVTTKAEAFCALLTCTPPTVRAPPPATLSLQQSITSLLLTSASVAVILRTAFETAGSTSASPSLCIPPQISTLSISTVFARSSWAIMRAVDMAWRLYVWFGRKGGDSVMKTLLKDKLAAERELGDGTFGEWKIFNERIEDDCSEEYGLSEEDDEGLTGADSEELTAPAHTRKQDMGQS